MKRKLKKPGTVNSVKTSSGLGLVQLAATSKDECTDPGNQYTSQACKGSKCCNGAGGC